jgi:hypothetical protein
LDNTSTDVVNDADHSDINIDNDQEEEDRQVSFNATVMAAVIAEAAADDNEDQFLGASFA